MIGIIGGSGLYEMEGLTGATWKKFSTPYGDPSDEFFTGKLEGRDVVFLPRHGRGHRILPSELNHRANIWAFKKMGVRFLISVSAVGSLREELKPLDLVLPDQFIDRTKKSSEHTFFGQGIVAHVALGDPISAELQNLLFVSAQKVLGQQGPRVHRNGTYVNMEGPAFSTRAESRMYRNWGGDIIGMTNLGESRLAREAEIAYASLAMVTDYDSWKTDEEPVTVDVIIARLHQNADHARAVVRAVVPTIPLDAKWPCHAALDTALVTDRKLWPASTVERVKPILERFLG